MTAPPGAAEAALDRLFAAERGAALGLAVSGGGDSMALMALAAERAPPGMRLHAVTVDHGLRPEATAEAALVGRMAARLGLDHAILTWDGRPARGNLQAAAREARFRLIGDWARRRGIGAVALGHTRDDQAETVLLRLARGSGVDGLAGMAAAREEAGIRWLRPLLDVPREALRAALMHRGIDWAEDASNADARFRRVRARAALAALAPLGIDAAGLAATARRMQRARAALEAATADALAAHARDDRGTVLVERGALDLLPEIRDRLFARLLAALAGHVHRPRLAALHRWLDGAGTGATLAGVRIGREGARLRLFREHHAVARLRVPATDCWDGRWRALAPPGAEAAEIAALGEAGLCRLSRQARAGRHPHWRAARLPQPALAALPAIWRGEDLVAAPLALWPAGWGFDLQPAAAPPGGGTIRIE